MKYKILVLFIFLSTSVNAWECPVCKKSFASVDAVPHDCDQVTALPHQLSNLVSTSGFAFYPSSKVNALSIISDYLEYLPLYKHEPNLPWDIMQWLYHWFEHLKLCQHGGGVGGSWSTRSGEAIRKQIKNCKIHIPDNEAVIHTTSDNSKIIDSFSDWYYGEAGMCGCGNPELVYKLLYDALSFFQKNTESKKPYSEFPVTDSKLRNCFISWLIYQELLSPQLYLTSRGLKILFYLQPGYPDYENDPCNEPESDV